MQTINRFQRDLITDGGQYTPDKADNAAWSPEMDEAVNPHKYKEEDKTDVQIAAEQYADSQWKGNRGIAWTEGYTAYEAGWKACEKQIQNNQWTDEELLEILKWGYLMGQKNTGIVNGTEWITAYKELKESK